ncbi:hypothetical protein GCM10010172_40770 [Paractinoplanes ferrugineus]|uniref:Uncharacterized protein n=2 Tax=Paractinoplanes ferrugineus TaxID=113564 RepID=A0A919MDW1_9ACTN|nr:hypothetical protein Afe05nite_39930 [Actinoplanes ferrugineus]
MHVVVFAGKLSHVTFVARVLPMHWDSRRLMRFFAGLAMLALAFTTPAPAPATPVAVPSVAVVESVTAPATSVAVRASVPAPSVVRVEHLAPAPAPIVTIIALATLAVLTGASPRVRGERAPPAIRFGH